MNISRRTVFTAMGAAGLVGCASGQPHSTALAQSNSVKPEDLARNEAYWAMVARDFDLPENFINLENGYWGLMARPVLETYIKKTRMINTQGAHFVRQQYNSLFEKSVQHTAKALGAKDSEVVLTRGATEALKSLIGGYQGLKPGDAVMYADLDYYSMQDAMDSVAMRQDCSVVRVNIPEPVTYDSLIQFYDDALIANPKTRLLLLTHVNHKTGLVVPVREIVALARKRGVDVIVDAAHSIGQIDYTVGDLGADFIGFNLHKWIGAPVGVGAMYVKEARLNDIATDIASRQSERASLKGRVHSGTSNFAAMLSVPAAFDYHEKIGRKVKETRLRHLRNVWVEAACEIANLQILAPDDPRMHAAITSFRLRGRTSVDDNKEISNRLLKDHGIFTVHRTDIAKGACVRVTPSIYNSTSDCLAFATALGQVAKEMRV